MLTKTPLKSYRGMHNVKIFEAVFKFNSFDEALAFARVAITHLENASISVVDAQLEFPVLILCNVDGRILEVLIMKPEELCEELFEEELCEEDLCEEDLCEEYDSWIDQLDEEAQLYWDTHDQENIMSQIEAEETE